MAVAKAQLEERTSLEAQIKEAKRLIDALAPEGLEALTTALGEQQAERKRLDDSTDDSILADAAELEAESRTLTAARSNETDARPALDTARKADQEHVTKPTAIGRAKERTAVH